MRCGRRLATIALLMGCASGAAGCGKGGEATTVSVDDDPDRVLEYRSGLDLDVQRSGRERDGVLRVERFTYESVDGQRVPALFSVPTDQPPLGCVIYTGGFTQPKEAMPDLRAGMARLRLATFSIDSRSVSARSSAADVTEQIRTPEGVRKVLLDSVADVRVGLDWLSRRPECRSNIAVLGTSFGGAVATHLAAQDDRIKAAVLTSVGATFEQMLLVRPLAAKAIPDLPEYVPDAAEDPEALARAVEVLGPYDLARWIPRIAPRPVMLAVGRFDPLVTPADALELGDAARPPKTFLFYEGGHDPFAEGPDRDEVLVRSAQFLIDSLRLPVAI